MPKVCVVTTSYECGECGAADVCQSRSGTEWTDVTDEEFATLKEYALHHNRQQKNYTRAMFVVVHESAEDWRKGMNEFLSEAKKSIEAEAEKNARKQTIEAKRLATIQAKRELKEREKMTKLMEKYGV